MPNSSQLPANDDSNSNRVIGDTVRLLSICELDERLERYRLAQPKLEQQMLKSLRDYGQLSPVELEEAWIIYALVIDDGLQQVEVAQMLGRHKSWVNRRLALIERLCNEARDALRLGLLTPTQARHLTRLPRGNQQAATLLMEANSDFIKELQLP